MIFSSRDLPGQLNDRARFTLWHDIFTAEIADAQFFMAQDVPFHATFRAMAIGPLTYSNTSGAIAGVKRSAAQAASDEYYTVHINTCDSPIGGVLASRDVEITSGGALVNASRPTALTGGDHNSWALVRLPVALLEARFIGLGSCQGQVISPDKEALRLLRGYLGLLDKGEMPVSLEVIDHMATTIIDLTGLAIGVQGDEAQLAGMRGLRRARLEAVLDRIRRDYLQPGFSAEAVARRLGLSARYVQDLLAATGGSFSERVLELRLQYARQMLGAAHTCGMRIGEIVYASGFNDVSYFNRSFRRRFGCSPGATRWTGTGSGDRRGGAVAQQASVSVPPSNSDAPQPKTLGGRDARVGDDMIRTAIIEDDPATIDLLRSAIDAAPDVEIVAIARNVMAGMKLIETGGYDVLLCDLGLPDGSGISLIRASADRYPAADIIVITIFADQAKVLDSIKAGARGYLLKDEHLADCVEGIRDIRKGGSPVSPIIARQLLIQLQPASKTETMPLREGLSPRELEILNLLARGFSNGEIGELIAISKLTVGTHVKNIYRKLEVNSRSEAVFEASSRGIMNAH